MEKFSKRQLKRIAEIWAGNELLSMDLEPFDEDLFEDSQTVLNHIHKHGVKILNGESLFSTLADIVEHVKKNYK